MYPVIGAVEREAGGLHSRPIELSVILVTVTLAGGFGGSNEI